jgi:hypothetical protein
MRSSFWNENWQGETEVFEKIPSHCHLVYSKTEMTGPRIESESTLPRSLRQPLTFGFYNYNFTCIIALRKVKKLLN